MNKDIRRCYSTLQFKLAISLFKNYFLVKIFSILVDIHYNYYVDINEKVRIKFKESANTRAVRLAVIYCNKNGDKNIMNYAFAVELLRQITESWSSRR